MTGELPAARTRRPRTAEGRLHCRSRGRAQHRQEQLGRRRRRHTWLKASRCGRRIAGTRRVKAIVARHLVRVWSNLGTRLGRCASRFCARFIASHGVKKRIQRMHSRRQHITGLAAGSRLCSICAQCCPAHGMFVCAPMPRQAHRRRTRAHRGRRANAPSSSGAAAGSRRRRAAAAAAHSAAAARASVGAARGPRTTSDRSTRACASATLGSGHHHSAALVTTTVSSVAGRVGAAAPRVHIKHPKYRAHVRHAPASTSLPAFPQRDASSARNIAAVVTEGSARGTVAPPQPQRDSSCARRA